MSEESQEEPKPKMNSNDKKALERIDEAISKLEINDFCFYFFVVDCKNVPNGSIQYIYQLAKTLNDKNYKVKMLYQLENEYLIVRKQM